MYRTLWNCGDCGANNASYGSCVTEGCHGYQDPPKENKMNAGYHPVKEIKQFRTIYDIIFELVRLGAALTGSRAFGMETNVSDWDFVIDEKIFQETANSNPVWKHFKLLSKNECEYNDANTATVLEGKLYGIHVQLSRDIKSKLAAQEFLLQMPGCMQVALLKMESKLTRRRVWDWALQQVGGHDYPDWPEDGKGTGSITVGDLEDHICHD